jgi:hypothetical protein
MLILPISPQVHNPHSAIVQEKRPLFDLSYEDLKTTARIRIAQKPRMSFWQLSVNTGSEEKCI